MIIKYISMKSFQYLDICCLLYAELVFEGARLKSITGSQLAGASLHSPLSGGEEASVNSASDNGALKGLQSLERWLLNNPALLHSSLGEINLRNNLSSAGSSVPCPGLGDNYLRKFAPLCCPIENHMSLKTNNT